MTEKEGRELKQVNIRLFKDQIEPLDRLWKSKFLNDRGELIRITIDKLLEENKEFLE